MYVGSLFSGIGGIELGFKRAGFTTRWFIENEPYAQAVLKKHFPEAIIYDDVTKIDFKQLPEVDILTGGFPCQDISNAGKRAGIKGDRSSLWKYYAKAISTLRPKFSFIENVSALLVRGLNKVLCDLSQIGYDAEWYCVPASSVGANHQRDRIFILAYPNSYRDRIDFRTNNEKKGEYWGRKESNLFEQYGKNVSYLLCRGRDGEQCDESFCQKDKEMEDSYLFNVQSGRFTKKNYRINKKTPNNNSPPSNSRRNKKWGGYWSVEPNVGRVVNGLPFRVDRIKCLGNAVVPQCAEVFAEAIRRVV